MKYGKAGSRQWLAVAILWLFIMGSIGPGALFSPKESYGHRGEESLLTVGIGSTTGNFNPFYYPRGADGDVVDLVFQRLFQRDREGNWIGDGAEDWSFSREKRTLRVTLKEGLTFSDGTPVTAEDVVFSYRVIADPSYAGEHNRYAQNLTGYQPYREGETEDFPGVRAIDGKTVEFHFEKGGEENLQDASFYIVPKQGYSQYYRYNDTGALQQKSDDPLGSGPYQLENLIMGEYVYLRKNPHYYQDNTYPIRELILQPIEENTEIDDLIQNNVDLIDRQQEIRNINIARKEQGIDYNRYYNNSQGLYFFNHEQGATKDPAVRKALRHAMDLEELITHYFDGYATIPTHFFGENSSVADIDDIQSLENPPYDLEKAARILEEGGWHLNDRGYREKDGEVLTLRILGSTHSEIIETLSPLWDRDWGNGLGIKIHNAYGGMDALMEDLIYDGDNNVHLWNVAFLELSLDPFTPASGLRSFFHSENIGTNRPNISRYQNEELDRLIEELWEADREKEQEKLYTKIGEILQQQDVYAPVYTPEYYDLYTERLQNFSTNSHFPWTRALETAYLVKGEREEDEEEGFPWRRAGFGLAGLILILRWKNRK